MPPESFFSVEATANGSSDEANLRVLRTWTTPPDGVQAADSTQHEMQLLFETLPKELSEYLYRTYGTRLELINEIYLQLGLKPKVILSDPSTGRTTREYLSDEPCVQAHIDLFASFFEADDAAAHVTAAKRKGIGQTLHRVSLVTNPTRRPERVIGVAVRVGRSLQGLLETMAGTSFLKDIVQSKQSLLLVGKPGVGKTTVLRQIARTLSDQQLEVVVVDKTCEIAGDGDMPHAAIGQSRWMPVGIPGKQHEIMREAVENQSPDVIIVDEISTPQEVLAARTIAQRGVMLIATVHGETLPELLLCKERGVLIGGVASVTLSGREADRRADKCKQVQKRAQEPIFACALELHTRSTWVFHPSIKEATDAYLEGDQCFAQEFQPGRAIAIAAIPGQGIFEYCRKCGNNGRGPRCPLHPPTNKASPFSSQDSSFPQQDASFTIGSNGGGGGRGRGDGRRRRR